MTIETQFADTFRTALKDSPYRGNMTRLSQDAGKNDRHVSNMLRTVSAVEGSDGPGFFTVARYASLMGVSLDDLLPGTPSCLCVSGAAEKNQLAERITNEILTRVEERLRTKDPAIEDVIRWVRSASGLLSPSDTFDGLFDLYEVPSVTDTHLNPVEYGGRSFTNRVTPGDTMSVIPKYMKHLPKDEIGRIACEYRVVDETGLSIQECEMMIPSPSGELSHVAIRYLRMLHPVRDALGNSYILNYSRPIEG